ncbi:Ig-like domain-containing protein [Jatrophihabitans telluris]|uniref:Ig-like domain-containing protein n=1 Tax=Jatrophihabitans telluris TaxID=2038343 RepID=A0ABY4QZM8_9ACTN|nr:Ig-like domain-containing protein [Jatrophihabitans telluris]UQX88904.1 Ig-like domain-containing protein [Jatrophihabitans telluris]
MRPTIKFSSLLGALLLLAGALTIAFSGSSAHAATINNAITDVTVGPSPVALGNQVTTTIKWKVPNGTQAGDTFQLTLDPKLRNLPSSFLLKDANGNVVATASVSNTVPAVITFTMTDFAASHINVSGSAFVKSDFTAAPGNQTFTYTEPDGTKYSSTVTVTGSTGPNRAHGQKFGAWTRGDQGRQNPTDFLKWYLETRTGPFTSATLSDTIQSPQLIDCATVAVLVGDTGGANGSFAHGTTYSGATVTCSTGALTVKLGSATAGQLFRVTFSVSLPAATGADSPAETFANTATETAVSPGGTATYHPGSQMSQADAGGEGSGTNTTPNITIAKGDSNGNAGDTAAAAVLLPDGTASLVFTITNTGDEALKNVAVTDQVITNGTVTGLDCTFPDKSTGTTWAGPLAVKGSFTCTAQLADVVAGNTLHEDTGTVTAVGTLSGKTVTDHNSYFGNTPEQQNAPPTPSPTESSTSPAPSSSTPLSPSESTSPPESITTPPTLPNTGANAAPVVLGVGMALVGTLLLLVGRRRPGH